MFGLAVLFGSFVGFAMGLTGGGGGVFAVPLLVYALGVAPREAVGISLAAVGGTALFGALPRLWRGDVEIRTGLLFAAAGMIGAPLGSFLAARVAEQALLAMFGCLMLVIAWRMWAKSKDPKIVTGVCRSEEETVPDRSACQRDKDGKLKLTSKCARLLLLVGLATGILSGMFGVGGGFVIVPALVLFSSMEIHRAVGTSLLAMFLISSSGIASYVAAGKEISLETTVAFLIGGFVGMLLGGGVAKRIKGPMLQKVFSFAVVLVAIFVIAKSTILS